MLPLKTFSGGLHPPQMKLTADKPVVTLPLPDRVILHVAQHKGAPAKPILKIRDEVSCGEKIAVAGGFVSAPVHASVSGKIVGAGNFMHPMGVPSYAVVIERNKEAVENTEYTYENGLELSVEEIRNRIQESGVVGLGGATFPTHVKLTTTETSNLDTVILNGAECEPALTTDHRMMLEHADEIINGLELVMKVLGVKRGIIGIEDNKTDAIELLVEKLKDHKEIQVQPLEAKYPQGGEKQLITACLGREIPSGKLPLDVGVVVLNVTSAMYISYGVNYQKPLIERTITLAGNCVKNPGNYLARLGTTVSDVIEMAGGLKPDVPVKKIIMGGPMMGFGLFDLNVPVIKGTGGILCWDEKEAALPNPTQCLWCGNCERSCPMGLQPYLLKKHADHSNWEGTFDLNVLDCIECGCCAYTCPAALPLVQSIKLSKIMIHKQNIKDKK
jgi:electron transport complex protein RnfC